MVATQTTEHSSKFTKIYKFEGVDCVAGETLPVIDASGFSWAAIYAIENTDTAGAGSGKVFMRAVSPDNTDPATGAVFMGFDSDLDGDLDTEMTVMATTATSLKGSVVEFLPQRFSLVHNGGNTGTALTIDLYVELHA